MLETLWVARLCHESALKSDSLPIFSGIRAAGIAVSATYDDLTAAKKPGFFVRSYVMATTRQLGFKMGKIRFERDREVFVNMPSRCVE